MIRLFYSLLLFVGVGAIFLTTFSKTTHAQTITPVTQQSASAYTDYRTPDTDPNVPHNSHTYTQAVIIDVLSAITCQLTGIDPVDPKQPCLTINPLTKKIGLASTNSEFGQSQTPQVGGALGMMTGLISVLYVPTVSSTQYTQYLSDNFGIVKSAIAAPPAPAATEDCSKSQFGYGFCGLKPIFKLWTATRDIAYFFLILCFVFLAVGVMLRFKIDPRTVMTLQNQIPRVIIAILLITFSYAIVGAMIDLMWTATYVGVNLISSASPDSKIASECGTPQQKITQVADSAQLQLLNQPISFTDTIFNSDCNGIFHSGIFSLSEKVSKSIGGLITSIVSNLLGLNVQAECGLLHLGGCISGFFLWITEQIVKLIIIVAIFVALFRLWFELLKTYLTLIIFIIFGPIYIVVGLIPAGSKKILGFEKWIRIVFANLAAFPMVAFILVFGKVMVDAIPASPSPQAIFIPPLIGNPNVDVFSTLLGFGAVMLAPTIPGMIRERMDAKGKTNYGAAIAGGIGVAAGAATGPGAKAWQHLNRRDSRTGEAVGAFAVAKQRVGHGALKLATPVGGQRMLDRMQARRKYAAGIGGESYKDTLDSVRNKRGAYGQSRRERQAEKRQAKGETRQARIDERNARRNPQPPETGGDGPEGSTS
jgi:hypothetical protein